MQYRPYGKHPDVQLSLIGFGGIVASQVSQAEAEAAVSRAVDRGINYFDVAPSYHDAEQLMGPAIEPYRRRIFLACKTGARRAESAQAELEQSLRRLRSDHFDLYQLHAMTSEEDFQQATAPGGALEVLVRAREQGKVRFLGFSAHSVEIALKLMDAFPFDSILFPVNWVNYWGAGFGPQVVAKAQSLGLGILALKAMARTRWETEAARQRNPKCWYEPCNDPEEAALALRWTLSQPITAAVPPGDERLFWQAVDVAERFTPIEAQEEQALRARAANLQPLFTLAGQEP